MLFFILVQEVGTICLCHSKFHGVKNYVHDKVKGRL